VTAVAVSAGWFAAAWLTGMGLGFIYELLRPLRPRLTALSDGMFTCCLLYAWLHLAFGICGGDIRMAQPAGMLLGALTFRFTAGKPLERIIKKLVRAMSRAVAPAAAFLKKRWKILKKIFASGRKSVTIKWSNRRHPRRHPGGKTHGKKKESLQPDPAGLPPQQAFNENGSSRSHRTVYGGADLSGRCQTFGKREA
jgi:hypothetical protein